MGIIHHVLYVTKQILSTYLALVGKENGLLERVKNFIFVWTVSGYLMKMVKVRQYEKQLLLDAEVQGQQ